MKLWSALVVAVLGLAVFAFVIAGRKSTSSPLGESERNTAVSGERTPVLVELFTSEGCSSCPPADDVLSRFERTQVVPGVEIIALAEQVDYWNRLGWTDPYSDAAFSERQGGYARSFAKDGVYTPQMIVDGQAEFPGGNRDRALSAIAEAAKAPKARIEITMRGENIADKKTEAIPLSVRIGRLPAVRNSDTAEVVLAITESNLYSDVPRGENAGRRLQHPSTVRRLSSLGTANAQSELAFAAEPIVTIEREWGRKNLRAVVFVQERASRQVLGAKAISLAAK